MIHTDFAVVIAHYAKRSVNDLEVLLADLGELCSHLTWWQTRTNQVSSLAAHRIFRHILSSQERTRG